jgi:transcriptional regulator with XRE-family HTH domain
MELENSVQIRILEAIKHDLPSHISLVDELAELLNVSKDSAYRRLRGEKSLDIREIQILASHFNLSLDSILNTNNNVLSFNTQIIGANKFTFKDWLCNVLNLLGMVSQMENGILSYFARDLPIFHHFLFPELGAFKLYFWFKTYLNDDEIDGLTMDLDHLPPKVEELMPITKSIWEAYARTASEEIWTSETVNILLKQILYYYEAGILKSRAQALKVLEQYQQVIEIIQNEASLGVKSINPGVSSSSGATFNLYYNEVSMGDNSILFSMGEKKMAFITSSIKIFMNTADPVFCDQMERYHNNFKRKSTLLSKTSEKERLRLFADIKSTIDQYRTKIR